MGAGDIAQMRRERLLQACGFRPPGAPFSIGGAVNQTGGELSGDQIHRREAVDQIFVIPRTHHRAVAFHPERGTQRRYQGKACFILA